MSYKPTHANATFTKFGAPEVDKLYNDRYRIVVRCNVKGVDSKWHWSNVANFWKDFGSLYETPLQIDGADTGWEPASGEAYPNMRLVEVSQNYPRTPNDGAPVVEFTYETLTTSYVQDADEKVDYELNGLRRVTRTAIASEDTSYGNTVGSSTIAHESRGYASLTLTLASAVEVPKRENEGGSTRFQEVWVEAGTLSVSTKNLSEGVVEVTTVFLVSEGTTVGPATARSTSNFQGLKTISVTTLQDKDGNSLVDGGSNLVHEYEKKVDFTYPGVVGIRQDEIDSSVDIDPILMNFDLDPPVQSKVTGTVSVIFQTSSTIAAADETYDDGTGAATGYWNPTEWAKTYVSGIGHNYSAFVESQGLRGYRVNTDVSGITEIAPTTTNKSFTSNGIIIFEYGGTTAAIEASNSTTSGSLFARVVGYSDTDGRKFTVGGKRLFGNTPFVMEVTGGPDDPTGNKYVLDIDIRPAFEDVDGTIYFKKTIVTATV